MPHTPTAARRASPSARRTPHLFTGLVLLAALLLGGCASLPDNVQRTPSAVFTEPAQTALGQLIEKRRPAGAAGRSAFALLDSADLAFAARVALVDAAQKTIDIQYYAIHADATTDQLFDHLRAAARRGVRIRVLIDDFNQTGPNAQVLKIAFEKNIEVRLFNPLPGGRSSLVLRILGSLDDVPRIQRRMHNKVFMADSAFGITGGRNIGETYFGQGKKSNFIDTDLLAAGPVALDLAKTFDGYWNNELSYPVESLMSKADLDAAKQPKPTAAAEATPAPAKAPEPKPDPLPENVDLATLPLVWANGTVLADKASKIAADADDVDDAGETVVDGLLQLIAQARKDLLIVSPYFVPGERMMAEFAALRARGVRLRVLTNSLASNDAPLAHVGYARYREALLKQGIELYEMRSEQSGDLLSLGSAGKSGGSVGGQGSRASLHAKIVVMDGRLLVVGSMNLDLRSKLQNSEVAVVVRSRPLSQAATKLIETTLADGSYRVELDGGRLVWRAPGQPPLTTEPDAGLGLKFMLMLIGPLAPDEML